jgi:hypothetical protein
MTRGGVAGEWMPFLAVIAITSMPSRTGATHEWVLDVEKAENPLLSTGKSRPDAQSDFEFF